MIVVYKYEVKFESKPKTDYVSAEFQTVIIMAQNIAGAIEQFSDTFNIPFDKIECVSKLEKVYC